MFNNKDKKQKEQVGQENQKQPQDISLEKEAKEVEDFKEDEILQIKKSELGLLNKEIEEYKKKSEDNFDRFLRLQAEFENAKKRMQREQQEFIKYANEGLISELLGILDDLERSVEAQEEKHQDAQAFLKGIEMILSHLYELLKKHNVRPIEVKGKIFDPHQHEALMQVESDKYPENTVIDELQKGYLLGDRIIRTAKVATAKSAKNSQKPQSD